MMYRFLCAAAFFFVAATTNTVVEAFAAGNKQQPNPAALTGMYLDSLNPDRSPAITGKYLDMLNKDKFVDDLDLFARAEARIAALQNKAQILEETYQLEIEQLHNKKPSSSGSFEDLRVPISSNDYWKEEPDMPMVSP